jgi:alpha-glucosidase
VVFPDFDWTSPNLAKFWKGALTSFYDMLGTVADGLWTDMNEVASFCDGSCGTGANLRWVAV